MYLRLGFEFRFRYLNFQCQGHVLPCHRYILSSRSTYFRKLLTGNHEQVSVNHTSEHGDEETSTNHTSSNNHADTCESVSSDHTESDTYTDSHEQVSDHHTNYFLTTGAGDGFSGHEVDSAGITELRLDCKLEILTFVLKYIYADEVDTGLIYQKGKLPNNTRLIELSFPCRRERSIDCFGSLFKMKVNIVIF